MAATCTDQLSPVKNVGKFSREKRRRVIQWTISRKMARQKTQRERIRTPLLLNKSNGKTEDAKGENQNSPVTE